MISTTRKQEACIELWLEVGTHEIHDSLHVMLCCDCLSIISVCG